MRVALLALAVIGGGALAAAQLGESAQFTSGKLWADNFTIEPSSPGWARLVRPGRAGTTMEHLGRLSSVTFVTMYEANGAWGVVTIVGGKEWRLDFKTEEGARRFLKEFRELVTEDSKRATQRS